MFYKLLQRSSIGARCISKLKFKIFYPLIIYAIKDRSNFCMIGILVDSVFSV